MKTYCDEVLKSKNNVVTFGLSGKIGDLLIFRQRNGKTVVAKLPSGSAKSSEKQQQHRKRFQQAVIYGKATTASPEMKAIYETNAKKGRVPFNAAVADFLHAPQIENIDLSDYTGQAGDVIRITVSDDMQVTSVSVLITNADGSLVEEGDAAPDAGGYTWTYTATRNNDNLDGDKIVITASDLPGNVSKEEQSL
jgi:hypothetical protein